MPHSKCFSSGGLLSKSLAFKLSTMRDCRIERLHDRESGKGNYASSWHCQAGGNWHWKCQFWCVFEPNTIQTERKLQRHFTMLSRDVCVCVCVILLVYSEMGTTCSKQKTHSGINSLTECSNWKCVPLKGMYKSSWYYEYAIVRRIYNSWLKLRQT